MTDQIDIVNGRTSPLLRFSRGLRWDKMFGDPGTAGTDYSTKIGREWQVTHDTTQAFASCTLKVVQPFTVGPGQHIADLYCGWNVDESNPLVPVFSGVLQQQDTQTYLPGDTLTLGGWLKLTDAPLGRNKAFLYVGDTIPATEDRAQDIEDWLAAYDGGLGDVDTATVALLQQIPDGFQVVPIWTDADLIVHLLESYNLVLAPNGPGYSIEASAWIPARINPILLTRDQAGYPLIKNCDIASGGWVTFDGRFGEVRRRKLSNVQPTEVVHVFSEQGAPRDILPPGVKVTRTYANIFNQVAVTGAYNATLNKPVMGYAPADPDVPGDPGEPEPSDFIHDPPGVRMFPVSSPLTETVPDAEELAALILPIVNAAFSECEFETHATGDYDNGDPFGIDSAAVFENGVGVSHVLTGTGKSRWRVRLAIYA